MNVRDSVLKPVEKITFALREKYIENGYVPYSMNKFEEYDLYARNKDFLVSDHVITFTDTGGKLMALRPDVTLSIIKNMKDNPSVTEKVFYDENVYRVSKGTGCFSEIKQSGVECIGAVDEETAADVIFLAADCLRLFGSEVTLSLSDTDIIEKTVEAIGLPGKEEAAVFEAIQGRKIHEIDALVGNEQAKQLLCRLLTLPGPLKEALPLFEEIAEEEKSEPFTAFLSLLRKIKALGVSETVRLDFSVIGDTNYYNGVFFRGFVRGIPEAVLSGGRYDRLMAKMSRRAKAIGFAVYTGLLAENEPASEKTADPFINVALPKGRLGEQVYELFKNAGFECPEISEGGRKLIFENAEKKVRYFWAKPSDVAIYVERGAADIGVAGLDTLLEGGADVYELLDLGIGKCRMCVAAPEAFTDDGTGTLRVATKFSGIAGKYYRSIGRDIDIIHLNGSIELAPVTGLSDCIVDIVETGTTLRENHLEVKETILPISARLIANKSSYMFKDELIRKIVSGLSAEKKEKK